MNRIGIGSDTHRLLAGEGFPLGGVMIPCGYAVQAHSDGDVLMHALVDALLGALGQGDIGELFPDTDNGNKNRASADFVAEACRRLGQAGGRIHNVDSCVFLQEPKLASHKSAIRNRIADLLGIPTHRVNVKAKTGERVGPVGRGEAISAEVAVLIDLPDAKD